MTQLYRQALKLVNQAKFSEAMELCNQCIKSKPGMLDAYKLRSQALYYGHQYKSAEDSYAEIISRFPNSQYGYYGRAFMLTLLGNLTQVEDLYAEAIGHNEKNYRIYLCQGYTCSIMGKHEGAVKMYEKAVTRNPLENPVTYICGAEALFALQNAQTARRYIKYAKKAALQHQQSNILYTFELKNIQELLNKYELKIGSLKKAQQQNLISSNRRLELQTKLTKALAKAVILNNSGIFDQFQYQLAKSQQPSKKQHPATQEQIAEKGAVPWCDCPACTIF